MPRGGVHSRYCSQQILVPRLSVITRIDCAMYKKLKSPHNHDYILYIKCLPGMAFVKQDPSSSATPIITLCGLSVVAVFFTISNGFSKYTKDNKLRNIGILKIQDTTVTWRGREWHCILRFKNGKRPMFTKRKG